MPTLTYTDTGLAASTTYQYRVRAKNSSGVSAWSNTASATTFAAPPATPTFTVQATTQTTIATRITGDSMATYKIEVSHPSTPTAWRTVHNGTITPTDSNLDFNITGLMPGVEYNIRVTAYNSEGTPSASSATGTGATKSIMLYVGTVTTTTAKVNFDNITGATNYDIDVTTDNPGGSPTWTNKYSGAGTVDGAQRTTTLTGLTAGTTYYIRGRARNATENGGYSALVTAVLIPAAPTGVQAAATSTTAIKVDWTAVPGAASYIVERSANGTSGWTSVGTPTTNQFTNSSLTTGTTYYFRVFAVNSGGQSAASSVVSATTSVTAPPTPTGFTATVVSDSRIDLSWSSAAGAVSYLVEKSTDQSNWTTAYNGAATSVQVTGLASDTMHYFRARATNAGGDSAWSTTISKATLPVTPTLTVIGTTQTSVTIRINA